MNAEKKSIPAMVVAPLRANPNLLLTEAVTSPSADMEAKIWGTANSPSASPEHTMEIA
jgi:hypothetical protein